MWFLRELHTAEPIYVNTNATACRAERIRSEDSSGWYRYGTTAGADHG